MPESGILWILQCIDEPLNLYKPFTVSPTGSVNNQPVAFGDTAAVSINNLWLLMTPMVSITNLWLIVTRTVSIEYLWPFSAPEFSVAISSVLKHTYVSVVITFIKFTSNQITRLNHTVLKHLKVIICDKSRFKTSAYLDLAKCVPMLLLYCFKWRRHAYD